MNPGDYKPSMWFTVKFPSPCGEWEMNLGKALRKTYRNVVVSVPLRGMGDESPCFATMTGGVSL